MRATCCTPRMIQEGVNVPIWVADGWQRSPTRPLAGSFVEGPHEVEGGFVSFSGERALA